ncbi:MAG: hypothetical protein FGM46_00990 [Ferruginibacter sp.]|nr:hypothetical protein [Ferruginibacter sp.]
MVKKWARKLGKRFFIVANIIVSLVFLISIYGSRIHSGYWYLGFFSTGSFFILVALLGFMLLWLLTKPRYALIGVLSIVLCWSRIGHLFQFRFSGDFQMSKNEKALRVMSWNVKLFNLIDYRTAPDKKSEMINFINKMGPDILCVQEMAASDNIPKAYNYLPDIISKLGGYNFKYHYNPAHDFGNSHHFGLMIVSRYPIIKSESISCNRKKYNSTFLFADLVKETDTFRVFNVHLESLRFNDETLRYLEELSVDNNYMGNSKNVFQKMKTGFIERKKQSDFLKKHIDESPYPVIICGDFNDVPNSYAYYTIGKEMKNAFAEKGVGLGATFNAISPTLRIDNIFCNPSFDVLQYDRFKTDLSDHFPIIADLSFIKKTD